ncbi:MAG: hypothetical protein GY829_11315 [Gammaproteobacteria bacterium]|nr:hypothetical protein [Gammaproteobacteria bacterium]
MNKKIDRLRRQQQRLWRKAAASILSLHSNIAVLLAFLMIIVLGIFWTLIDHKLEKHLLKNTRTHGYSITRYALDDLSELIISGDTASQEKYLKRLTNDRLVIDARLFDYQGTLLAKSYVQTQVGEIETNNDILSTKPETLTLLEDIKQNDIRIGIIQIKIDRQRVEAPIQKLLNSVAMLTVGMMIIAIIVAWLISKRLTRSLRRLLKFPINTPEDNFNDNLDVGSELKLMLESSSNTTSAPAPVSKAEHSGIHQLLAADSEAESAEVVILKIYLCDLTNWLKHDTGTPNVQLLRQLDRLLISTIHSQQGHLLSFDGITAQACFGLDGDLASAAFRAASCSLLLKTLLEELSLQPKMCLRKEERLLIRHMKRTPIAIPIHSIEEETNPMFTNNTFCLLLHKSINKDPRLLEQMQLTELDQTWKIVDKVNHAAQAMLDRKLTWIRYLMSDTQ